MTTAFHLGRSAIRRYPGDHDGTDPPTGAPPGVAIDGPIESYRLKMVREGLEDWELLLLAADRLGRDAVLEPIAPVYTRLGGGPEEMPREVDILVAFEREFLGLEERPPTQPYDPDHPP